MMHRMVAPLVAGFSLSAGAQQGFSHTDEFAAVDSPIKIATRAPDSQHSTPLEISAASLRAIGDSQRVLMMGVPLSAAETVDLELTRMSVFSSETEFVSGNNPADSLADLGREDRTMLFGGEVSGVPGSGAYLAITPTGTNGFIKLDGQTHIITSGRHTPDALTRVYNLTTLPEGTINWKEFQCNAINPQSLLTLDESEITAERVESMLASSSVINPVPDAPARGTDSEDDCRLVRVAIETDVELGQQFVAAGEDQRQALIDYVDTLIGAVNFIYDRNLNLQMRVIYFRDWVGEPFDADPWDGQSTVDLLFELKDEWTPDSAPTNLDWQGAHLLSYQFFGGGVAFVNAMCNQDFAHAVSADLDLNFPVDDAGAPIDNAATNWDVIVVTHEWGHNLGAPHTHGLNPVVDGCGLGDCSDAENGTIMSYCQLCPGGYTNIELNFAERILDEGIRPYIAGQAPCNLFAPAEECDTPEPEPECIADVNGDMILNGADFTAWIIAYNAGDLTADSNGDGRITPSDFNAWLLSYNEGCDFGGM